MVNPEATRMMKGFFNKAFSLFVRPLLVDLQAREAILVLMLRKASKQNGQSDSYAIVIGAECCLSECATDQGRAAK